MQTHTTMKPTSSSAVAERPRDASRHCIFRQVTQGPLTSFGITPSSRACVSPYQYSMQLYLYRTALRSVGHSTITRASLECCTQTPPMSVTILPRSGNTVYNT